MAGKYRCIGKNRLGTIQNDFQLLIRGMTKKQTKYFFLYSHDCKQVRSIGDDFQKVKV
jgi:hypothetical protein